MKTLVNCTPTEFFAQTNKIREKVSSWLEHTNILEIRKKVPTGLPDIDKDMNDDEKAEVLLKRNEMMKKQVRANFSEILESIFSKAPEETIEIMALACFIEPEDADKHTMSEYIGCLNEMLEDEAVIGFFSSLERLGVRNTSDVPKL